MCCPHLSLFTVLPPMNLRVRGVSENTVDLEWQGSMILTDFLITYAPTTPGGVQLEIRVPGNVTNTTIKGLEPGLEYNINVYAVIDNIISAPMNTIVSTCECTCLLLRASFIQIRSCSFHEIVETLGTDV